MSESILKELHWIGSTFLLALAIGWLSDQWFWVFFVYLLVYIARQLYSMNKFENWVKGERNVHFPPTSGFWGELSFYVSRKQRALEKHANLQFYRSEQFQAASMTLPDAIVALNEKNQIEWFNAAAQRLLRLRKEDYNHRIETFIRIPQFVRFLKSNDHQKPLILNSLLGHQRVYSASLFTYYKGHKLLIIKDVHEFYSLAQIRRDFIANASHELRTPLTVLNGYIEMMREMHDEDSIWYQPLQQMHIQSDRMQSIIKDLLTLSAMESQTITEPEEMVDVGEILMRMKTDVQQMSDEDHQFVFEIDETVHLKGFKGPINSVLTNLISNAVRYTPANGLITIKWFADKQGAHFEVSDSGVGIAPEHINRITERFYRVDTARSRETGGTGLGLAIVKHILERHQATLHIESHLGQGSTFSCDFPKKRVIRA